MAYGFNNDKSRFDLGAMHALIEGAVTVPAKSARAVLISQSQVNNAGIDNLSNYMVVSAVYSTDEGVTWHTDIETPAATLDAFPRAIVASLNNAGNVQNPMRVQLVNNTTVNATMSYRVVLMRVPSTSN